jgi:hypothetical protein
MLISFLAISLIGFALIFLTSLIMYELFGKVWLLLTTFLPTNRVRVILILFPIFLAHILNIWLYAGVFLALDLYTDMGKITGLAHITGLNFSSFLDCLYFSSISYTTVGFGDLVATGPMRMLSGTEALNGLILMGWTISFTYLSMEDFWKSPE